MIPWRDSFEREEDYEPKHAPEPNHWAELFISLALAGIFILIFFGLLWWWTS